MIGEAPEQQTMADISKAGYRKIVNNAVNILLGCGDNVGIMKHAVDELYRFFRSITDIGIDDQNTPDIFLASGKAISPEKAAHCLLEMKRTAILSGGFIPQSIIAWPIKPKNRLK